MSFFSPQNPGIDGIDELTNAEEAFLTSLAGLSFSEGEYLKIVSGQPSWEALAAAGSDTQVQFNDGGAFGGDAGLTYDKTTNKLSAGSVAITETAGNGHITLVSQSVNPAAPAAGTLLIHSSTIHGFTRMEQDNEAPTNLIYGRDNVFIVKNTSGGTISKGQVVYVTGSTGNVPNVAKAQANSSATLPSVAVAVDDITDNSFGQVMTVGVISGFDTSTFTTGDPVWVSPTVAGGLVNTRPSGTTNAVQRVGSILVSGVENGSLMVNVAPAVLNMETGTNAPTWTGTNVVVADEAYGAGWNGSLQVPTKNALYDKIETLGGASVSYLTGTTVLNFGATGETDRVANTVASALITSANIKSTLLIPTETAETSLDDVTNNNVSFHVENIVDGVSFDIVAMAGNMATGNYTLNYSIAY